MRNEDRHRELEEILEILLNKLLHHCDLKVSREELLELIAVDCGEHFKSDDLWDILWLDGKFDLIRTLRYIELKEVHAIVVPADGFSENDHVHNLVLKWLRQRKVNIVNPRLFEARLEAALYHTEMV